MRQSIVFYLNGKRQEISDARAGWTLSDFLRYERGLTGTKVVCAEGDCGACSVLKYTPRGAGKPRYVPINSCIALVAQLDGSSVLTVEALSDRDQLSPTQAAMLKCHGSQCGFCTPGFVVALTGLVEKKLLAEETAINRREAMNCLTGNLCRCTGYEPILEAASQIPLESCAPLAARYWSAEQARELARAQAKPVRIETEEFAFFAPRKLREAAAYLKRNLDARILASGTDLGVQHNKRTLKLHRVLSLHLIPELEELQVLKNGRVRVGARVTLTQLRLSMKKRHPEFARFLDLFASPQIKNGATLVGNVCNASPIADTPPFLLVQGATLRVQGPRGARSIALEDFYLEYRKTALLKGELVSAIELDPAARGEALRLFKVSQRKDLDISTVNAAFCLTRKGRKISQARLALGGVAAIPLRLKRTEARLTGRELDPQAIEDAVEELQKEISPITDLRGSSAFRRVAAENLFRKFLREQLEASR